MKWTAPSLLALLAAIGAIGADASVNLELEAARQAFQKRDYASAIRLADEACKSDSAPEEAFLLQAEARLAMKDIEGAYERINSARRQFEDSPGAARIQPVFVRVARLRVAELDRLLSRPNVGEDSEAIDLAAYEKADIHLRLNEPQEALKALTRAIGKFQGHPALLRRADVHHAMGRLDLAIGDYRAYLQHTYSARDASKLLQWVADLKDDPRLIAESTFTLEWNAGGWDRRAEAYERTGKTARAIADYRQLLRQDRRAAWVQEKLVMLSAREGLALSQEADVILTEGERAMSDGRPRSAAERARTALALNPRLLSAQVLLARALHVISPSDEEPLRLLSEAREEAGEREAEVLVELRRVADNLARRLADQLAKDPPDSTEQWIRTLHQLMALQVQAGNLDAGLATARTLVEKGESYDGHFTAAQIHELRRDTAAAVAAYSAAFGPYGPKTHPEWQRLPELRRALGDYHGLVEDSTRVLDRDPDDMAVREVRIEAFAALGDFAAALRDLAVLSANLPSAAARWARERYPLLRKAGDYEGMKKDCLALIRQDHFGYEAAAQALVDEAAQRNVVTDLIKEIHPKRGDFTYQAGPVLLVALSAVAASDRPLAETALRVATERGVRHAALSYALAEFQAGKCAAQEAASALTDAVQFSGGIPDVPRLRRIATILAGAETIERRKSGQRIVLLAELAETFPAEKPFADALALARQKEAKTTRWHETIMAELAVARTQEQVREQQRRELYEPAAAAEARGDLERAAEGYAAMFKAQPDHVESAARAIVVHLAAGRGREAADQMRALTETVFRQEWEKKLPARSSEANVALSRAAEWLLRLAARGRLSRPKAVDALSGILVAGQLQSDALALIAVYLPLHPDDPDLLAARGEIRLAAQKNETEKRAALADVARAVELRPGDHALRAR